MVGTNICRLSQSGYYHFLLKHWTMRSIFNLDLQDVVSYTCRCQIKADVITFVYVAFVIFKSETSSFISIFSDLECSTLLFRMSESSEIAMSWFTDIKVINPNLHLLVSANSKTYSKSYCPFALGDNDVFFLSSCANSYIGDNATHLWWHAYNFKNLCHCYQVRIGPYPMKW